MPGPSARHQHGRPPGLPTRGFYADLKRYCGIKLGQLAKFYPDAFEFNVETKTLSLYEVCVTHAISDTKFEKLGFLADALKMRGWMLKLFLGDSRGVFGDVCPRTGRIPEEQLYEAVNSINSLALKGLEPK